MNPMQSGGQANTPLSGAPLEVIVVVGLLALAAGVVLRAALADAERPTPETAKTPDSARWAALLTVTWVVVSYGLLVSLGLFTVELFVVAGVIGYFVVEFLMSPPQVNEQWWMRFRLLRIPALLLFGYVVFQRVMPVIQ